MTVKFLHKEKEKEVKTQKGGQQVAVIVEEMAEQKKTLDAAKKVEKKYNANRDKLKEMIDPNASEFEEVVFHGEKHNAEFSACSEQRTITDMKGLHAKLGDEVFYAICKVNLGDIDKYLTEDEKAKFTVTTNTGPRYCKIVEK